MYNQEFQKQQALRLLNAHLGRKPTTRTFINEDPNAAAILEMQGARIHKGRNYDVTVLPPELVNDEYFNKYTLPYMMPGKEIETIKRRIDVEDIMRNSNYIGDQMDEHIEDMLQRRNRTSRFSVLDDNTVMDEDTGTILRNRANALSFRNNYPDVFDEQSFNELMSLLS